VVGFDGRIEHDTAKPDGAPRKLLDVSRLSAMGWGPRITLRAGIQQTYEWYLKHHAEVGDDSPPAAARGPAGDVRASADTASPSWEAR
jgi:dTDP-D-glucose 4,6-dehydratase